MTRRLLLTYLTITAVALVALAVPLGITFTRRERDRLYFDIERDAVAITSLVDDSLERGTPPAVDDVLVEYRDRTRGRILVVDRTGRSVADSENPGRLGRDYSTRPEIASALDGGRAVGTRHSDTLGGNLVFVAVPVTSGGRVLGAVRVTFPTEALDERVRTAWFRLTALSIVVLAAVAAVGFALARSFTRPVRELELAAERIAAGDLDARVATDRGVPELRALAATFNATAARLAQVLGAQQRFVADAAHQLRTPLTALRLRLENLEPAVADEQREAVGAAIREVGRLSRLVDGLLLLARTDATEAQLEHVEVREVVDARVDVWRDAAREQGVTVVAAGDERAWVEAPHGALEQVLDNLLENALAVAPAGSEVTVTVERRGPRVELHVVDQGEGLDPSDRARAFERFWRGRRDTPGTGLGLAIVRLLAEAGGGTATLEAARGGGTDAVVSLPAVDPPSGDP